MVLLQLSFFLQKISFYRVIKDNFMLCSVRYMSHTNNRCRVNNCNESPYQAKTEDYHFNNRQLHCLPYRSKAPLHSHSIQDCAADGHVLVLCHL